jgi:hypothetical protein
MRSFKQVVTAFAVLAMSALSMPAFADPPYDLWITNNSPDNMVAFYAKYPSSARWSKNLFEDYMLPPGRSGKISLSNRLGVCVLDLKAVMDSGREFVELDKRLNVCNTTGWRISGY